MNFQLVASLRTIVAILTGQSKVVRLILADPITGPRRKRIASRPA
jgi:hypothetical protein